MMDRVLRRPFSDELKSNSQQEIADIKKDLEFIINGVDYKTSPDKYPVMTSNTYLTKPKQDKEKIVKDVDPSFKAKIKDRVPDLKTPLQNKVLGNMKILMEKIEKLIKAEDEYIPKGSVQKLGKQGLKLPEHQVNLPKNIQNMKKSDESEKVLVPVRPIKREAQQEIPKDPKDLPPDYYKNLSIPSRWQVKAYIDRIQKQLLILKARNLVEKAETQILTETFLREYRNKLILKDLYEGDSELRILAGKIAFIKGYDPYIEVLKGLNCGEEENRLKNTDSASGYTEDMLENSMDSDLICRAKRLITKMDNMIQSAENSAEKKTFYQQTKRPEPLPTDRQSLNAAIDAAKKKPDIINDEWDEDIAANIDKSVVRKSLGDSVGGSVEGTSEVVGNSVGNSVECVAPGTGGASSSQNIAWPQAIAKQLLSEKERTCTCHNCGNGACANALNKQLLSANIRKGLDLEVGKGFWRLYDRAAAKGVNTLSDEDLIILREFLYSRV